MTTPASPAAPLRPASASAAVPRKKRMWLTSGLISLGFAAATLGLAAFGLFLVPSFTNPRFLANLGVVGLLIVILALAWLTIDNNRVKSRAVRGVLLLVFAVLLVLAVRLDWVTQFDWMAAGLALGTVGIVAVATLLFEVRRRMKR
ncbi:hypothetical protein D9M69_565240 [compost metagenome]